MSAEPARPLIAGETELLERLQALVALIGSRGNGDDQLPALAAMAAELLQADACSIMLFKDDTSDNERQLRVSAHYGELPSAAYQQRVRLGEGIAGQVAASGRAILVPDVTQSDFAACRKRERGSFICAPIQVNDHICGVLNVCRNTSPLSFREEDLAIAGIVALLFGLALELARLQGVLRSRFALRAMARELRENRDLDPGTLGRDSERMARLLGRTFFRELDSAGFGTDRILTAATEVIAELGRNVGKTRSNE
ncbi:GAF domain-containing protein [Plasticicumulans acidivorans]|uniref:GAF domain-containing protein n=1 Tax=Plasticicumulans acidivorans TaxID=886464 RepID=A0A317MRQ5_9GAMM|nr:GAF domain-containing protein [Plasticicumulans acidivorans]PWV58514.1 GAF domain-containing protein [Plasticicumulans acidivorans]